MFEALKLLLASPRFYVPAQLEGEHKVRKLKGRYSNIILTCLHFISLTSELVFVS